MNKLILFLLYSSVLLYSNLLTGLASDSLSFMLQKDDPKLAQMDSLWSLEQSSAQQIEIDTSKLNRWSYAPDSIPFFSDSLIQLRLSILNEQTPFELVYNEAVKTQINIYANTYRNHISRMLGKANYYFPLFESKLDEFSNRFMAIYVCYWQNI